MIVGAILLLIAAVGLVVAELFLPTHGLLAVLAFLCAAASVYMAYLASPAAGLAFGILMLVASPLAFYGAVRIYPRTAVGRKVLLQQPAATSGFDQETEQLAALVGRQGVAMTLLRPAGSVEIDGRMIDAMSEDAVIEAGARIEVIRVSGMKVFVKAVG
jgi:membrane-bound serine protease (ClpP class)